MLPKMEGELHIREGKKSGWKKHVFVLRASGLYYSKAGRSLASKDIVRVVEWKDVDVYTGSQYKKFYRAPGSYCFSLVVSVCNGCVKCSTVLTVCTVPVATRATAKGGEADRPFVCLDQTRGTGLDYCSEAGQGESSH